MQRVAARAGGKMHSARDASGRSRQSRGLDCQAARRAILALVREMALTFPEADYSFAREQFRLLPKIRRLTGNAMPTAARCWEHVGLQRSHLVDEFEFAQMDHARTAQGACS